MGSACACTNHPLEPAALFEQAQLEFLRGDLVRARDDARRAHSRFSNGPDEWDCKFRLLEAEILVNQGRAEQAVSLLNPPLPARLSESDLAIKRGILLAIADARLGRLDESLRSLKDSTDLSEARHSALNGEVARAQGVVAIIRGDLDGAEHGFRTSLQISRQRSDPFLELTALLNLGVVAMKREHHDEAIEWLNRAQGLAQSLKARLTEQKALGDLGLELYYMGDFERSLALSLDAARQAHDLEADYDEVQWLDQIGLLHYQAGEWSQAGDYYQRSLALARKINNKEKIVGALTTLAFLAVKQGQFDDAEKFSRQAMESAKGDHPDELSPMMVQGLVAARRGDTAGAERLLQTVARDPESNHSQRWESEESLALLYEQENRPDAANRQYRRALGIFETARASIYDEDSRLPYLANASHLYDDYVHFLVEHGEPTEALQQADFSRAQTLAEGLGASPKGPLASAPLDIQQVARRENATILFYWLGAEHSYLWAITPGQVSMFALPPSSEIDARVQRYTRILAGPLDPLQSANEDGRKLYDILVGPAKALIRPGSRVIVIPDNSLDRLNFETLLVSEPSMHYWIEDVVLSSASSLRLLSQSRKQPSAGAGKLMLIGDALPSSSEYPPLPKAAAEMEIIARHFGVADERVYTGAQATPEAYLGNDPGQFSFIHFVAHGTASRLSPLDSAIVLSKSTAEEDSFKLYARDIIRYPLRADLVTISTCYGAGARAYSGEGLVGLSWAFLRAGAHNVIGALWEVSDTSTPQLMDRLYEELRKGSTPEAALRTAKLSLLRSGGVFRKPFYWAPFQLYTGA